MSHTHSTAPDRRRLLLPLLTLLLLPLAGQLRSADAATSSGSAWPHLAKKVDPIVDDAMRELRIPGISLAATKDGRLVLSKGYGYARIHGKATKMTPAHRARIGSVSKATITGPAAFQLMKAKGVNPKTQRLYGAGALFGSSFNGDYLAGIGRFSPIVAMAIAPDDKVYTWHTNGTVSVGTSEDLDRFQAPKPYKIPGGRKPVDIRAIAIAHNNRVHVWYEDGKRSVGTSRDLGSRISLTKSGTKFPKGKGMLDVVGITMSKSDANRVYAWYQDGTMSAGHWAELGNKFSNKWYSFAPGKGGTSYNIRGMGMAANGRIYTWFANGFASSGLSTKLHHYRTPYRYQLAKMPPQRVGGASMDLRSWYRSITVQHLLDHRSGFTQTGAGAVELGRAAKLLKKPASQLSYADVHRTFLRTRKLLFRPGTSSKYSNHNFGLLTLIIEKLSGTRFATYVRNSYLKPLGLHQSVIAERPKPETLDATQYATLSSGEWKAQAFKDYGLGLAAGGFRASARDLAYIMTRLEKRYTQAELADMGWGSSGSRGKLSHSGGIGGGSAFVVMFPKGFMSNSGVDLSDVHVAIVANTNISGSKLSALADQIALQIGATGAPSNYDIWKSKPAN